MPPEVGANSVIIPNAMPASAYGREGDGRGDAEDVPVVRAAELRGLMVVSHRADEPASAAPREEELQQGEYRTAAASTASDT